MVPVCPFPSMAPVLATSESVAVGWLRSVDSTPLEKFVNRFATGASLSIARGEVTICLRSRSNEAPAMSSVIEPTRHRPFPFSLLDAPEKSPAQVGRWQTIVVIMTTGVNTYALD